jgi:hypothetical protein
MRATFAGQNDVITKGLKIFGQALVEFFNPDERESVATKEART